MGTEEVTQAEREPHIYSAVILQEKLRKLYYSITVPTSIDMKQQMKHKLIIKRTNPQFLQCKMVDKRKVLLFCKNSIGAPYKSFLSLCLIIIIMYLYVLHKILTFYGVTLDMPFNN